MTEIRTRFAPSPTGLIHLGNMRTAFYCWLYARHTGGKFILRIEDTDQERSKPEYTQTILDSLKWLGLDHDEGPFYQSKRLHIYREISEDLIKKGLAYRCYCTKERIDEIRTVQLAKKEKPCYDGFCREKNLPHRNEPYVIRFKNPRDGEVAFHDLVAGDLKFSNTELDDLVIGRSDGFPTYNFSVVVDDLQMKITHVIRGADHINNTPRQINIFRALGAEPPAYAHLPLILGSDGKLLSKRHGAKSVLEYREEGFLKEALLNYLVRLGWSHGDQEIFSIDEMCKLFDIAHVNKSPAAFSMEKLLWLNRHYIKSLPAEQVAEDFKLQLSKMGIDFEHGPALPKVVTALSERAETLQEMAGKSRYIYADFADYEHEAKEKNLTNDNLPILRELHVELSKLAIWEKENIHGVINAVATHLNIKLGKVAQPLRVAVTGGTVSPPIDVIVALLGKDKVLQRLDRAIKVCAGE
jgi:glutamyl-tRNA synthetase